MDIRWLEAAAAVLALAVAPTTGAGSDELSGSHEPAVANTQDIERLEGVVVSVSEGAGKASIRSGQTLFTLNGTPMDLLELNRGNQVSIVYRRYGGVPWLLPSGTAGLGGGTGGTGYLKLDRPFMTTVGNVQRLDVPRGLVYLGDQAFHGHPAVVGKFEVGQRITVLYQSFGGTFWITPD